MAISDSKRPLVAVVGGTFNPVHNGHLRVAVEVHERVLTDRVVLMPCFQPVHRQNPGTSAAQRLAMLELAVGGVEGICVDTRELVRQGPSYSVDTLHCLRQELGGEVALAWVMGSDAFAGFKNWHRWQDILALGHLIVVSRPGTGISPDDDLTMRITDQVQALRQSPSGRILTLECAMLDISSTYIRELIESNRSPRFLLPEAVCDYIYSNSLYASGELDDAVQRDPGE